MTIATAGLPQNECRRCGHIWIPRVAAPIYCPLCHKLLGERKARTKAPATEAGKK